MKDLLKRKGYIVGTMLSEFYSPNAAALFKAGGFDYFIIDCEHGCYDFTMVASMVASAHNSGISAIIRVPQIEKEGILKYLEMGAHGLLVPMVSTLDETRRVVDFARYAPLGKRGISTRRAHNDYNSQDMKSYMARSNEEITILVQIETQEALQNLDQIAGVEGIDGLIVGPSDLSSSLGDFGNFQSEAFRSAVDQVIAAAKRHQRHVGFVHSNIRILQEYRSKGMDILNWNSEVGMILSQSQDAIRKIRE